MKENSQKVKERSYLMVYEFGNGKITVQSGRMNFNDKETGELKYSLPFVDLGILNEKKEVGEDLIGLDPEAKYYSKLFFANIESLEVLERALAFCRKELELKSETDNGTKPVLADSGFVSGCCKGEICSVCGKPATNKLEETIFYDDPNKMRHPLTAYVCREHFNKYGNGMNLPAKGAVRGSIFLIEKGWIDPMENRNADGYEPFGYKMSEQEAKDFCELHGYWTGDDCWSIRYKPNERMWKYRYKEIQYCP